MSRLKYGELIITIALGAAFLIFIIVMSIKYPEKTEDTFNSVVSVVSNLIIGMVAGSLVVGGQR